MGFIDRLTNLGKGWLSAKGKPSNPGIVDSEIEHDRLNPTPSAEAKAQLDALKAAAGSPSDTKEPAETPAPAADDTTDEDGTVKKTL